MKKKTIFELLKLENYKYKKCNSLLQSDKGKYFDCIGLVIFYLELLEIENNLYSKLITLDLYRKISLIQARNLINSIKQSYIIIYNANNEIKSGDILVFLKHGYLHFAIVIYISENAIKIIHANSENRKIHTQNLDDHLKKYLINIIHITID